MTLGEALKDCPVSEGMKYSPTKYKFRHGARKGIMARSS